MEFQGMGEIASAKNLDAGELVNQMLHFAESGETLYDCFKYREGVQNISMLQFSFQTPALKLSICFKIQSLYLWSTCGLAS